MNLRNVAAGTAACLALSPFCGDANAQSRLEQLPDIVVTAGRAPEPIGSTGSAISVISGDTLTTSNPASLTDALRSVPGLMVTQAGGPAGTTGVMLRGANTGQTLVLIDGVRVNDPSGAAGDFNFALVAPGTVDRVEVLRGPQSALYGSDAMGGVINIITKKGSGPAQYSIRTEGGSYGTASTTASMSGSSGPWNYAVTGSGQHTNGFSSYGYRIPAIEAKYPNLEKDGMDRIGGSARVGYDAGEGFRFDAGVMSTFTRGAYDASFGATPDTPSNSNQLQQQIWAKAAVDSLGGMLTQSITTFATQVDRTFNDYSSYGINVLPANSYATSTDFRGNSFGAEYQGDLKMGAAGSLIYGARTQHDTAESFGATILPVPTPRVSTLNATKDTNSVFALWKLPIGERLSVTMGGRVDDVVDVATFATWRTTAAYTISETGTKLRASAGTGAKAPTLYQLYEPNYGNSGLKPEESFGYDAGIDQSLFNGRVTLSLTGFYNKFSNLIDFTFDPTPTQPFGHYINVARAETSGLEVGADIDVMPGTLRLKTAYTWLQAKDLSTGLTLARRPEHLARIALAITPTDRWLIEPRILMVSKRFSSTGELNPLAAYTRVDLYTEYKIDNNWKVFARGENIFNERYQEVLNYGTTGPAVYGGFHATW
ncbi:MAG: TonB-dependent receptor [Rhizobiales bacterium]|nr:TonB-dependent receptor [Hyphomicrobiales bacterium]